MTLTVGVDVGGTSVRAGVVNGDGTVLDTARTPTPPSESALETAVAGVVSTLAGRRDPPKVNPVTADVEVFGVLMDAGHLDRRHQLDPEPLRRFLRRGHAGDGIVVGKRQRRNPGLRSFLDHFRGGQLPVRDGRMTLQLDQHDGAP